MKKMNKKQIVIIAVALVVMIAAIAVLAVLNAPKDKVNAGSLTIVQGENTLAVLTMEQLKKLPAVEVEVSMGSASSVGIYGKLKGVTIREVLNSINPSLTESGKRVYAYAEDGFVLTYNMTDILADDSIIVAYEHDGAPMRGKAEGGEGPLRVVVADDPHANRSCKYAYKLEVK